MEKHAGGGIANAEVLRQEHTWGYKKELGDQWGWSDYVRWEENDRMHNINSIM